MCRTLVLAVALTPLFAVTAALLGVAGALKLRSDRLAAQRALGAAELALAAAALAAPGTIVAALVAAAYAAFALRVARLLATGSGAPCGCIGDASAPAGRAHLLLDVAAAAVAAFAAARVPHGPAWVASLPPATAAALVLGAAAATYAAYLALALLPDAWRAYGAERGD